MMLPKDQELAQIQVKPENIVVKIGATKDGHIIALQHDVYINGGDSLSGHASTELLRTRRNFTRQPFRIGNLPGAHTNKLHPHRAISQLYTTRIEMVMETIIDEMSEAVEWICRVQTHSRFKPERLSPARDWTATWDADTKLRTERLPMIRSHLSKFWRRDESCRMGQQVAVPVRTRTIQKRPGGGYIPASFGQMGYHEGEEGFENASTIRVAAEAEGAVEFTALNSKLAQTAASS
jgi:hypothetical protein